MKRLKKRQEVFCRTYITNYEGTRSAQHAGYSKRTAASQASRLLRNPRIQARIAILQAEMTQGGCRDLDALIAKLENIYSKAINLGNYGAASAVVTAQAKLLGLGPKSRVRKAKEAAVETPEPPAQAPPAPPRAPEPQAPEPALESQAA